MNERRFHRDPDRLRAPERLARLEVDRVVDLCLDGIAVQDVLDVGSGTGVFAEAFAKRGIHATGIDVNPDMVAAATAQVPGARFVTAPAEAPPFPDKAFDVVFLGHVLHEADDAVGALKEAKRLARQRVVVLEWPYREEEMGPPLHHRLSNDQVEQFARQAGLTQVEVLPLTHMVAFRMDA